ncbi:MAG: hypothetical protein KIT09_10825 [Bryobacteraceae bacterium]|nr:hypothetical protein [Bryobacteraceae bacterium]
MALANLATEPAVITATIWDDAGAMLGAQNIPLAGSGHASFALPAEILLTAGGESSNSEPRATEASPGWASASVPL